MTQEDLQLKILKKGALTSTIGTFILERPNGFDYKPGQHVYIETRPELGTPLSLVSSPLDSTLQIATVFRKESDFKTSLNEKDEGDTLIVSGPYGKMVFDEESDRSVVMIAGGIGITPIVGMLRYIAKKKLSTPALLIYSNKSASEIAFKDELDNLSAEHPNLKIVYTLTQDTQDGYESGRIDEAMVRKHLESDPGDSTWFVVGAPAMVKTIHPLVKKDLGATTIKVEAFSGY